MKYYILQYSTAPKFAGDTRGPWIRINPKYKDDLGLLAHEKCHVRQWWFTLGIHSLLYLVSDKYKLWAEVQAYKCQLEYSPNHIDFFARSIATKYGLGISEEEAKELLKEIK